MKEKSNGLKERQPYQPPHVEIIEIEVQGVLCGSALLGNSTESVTTETFIFP